MGTPRADPDIELVMTSVRDARNRAERAQAVLVDLNAPAYLLEAVERSGAELAEIAERLTERLAAARLPDRRRRGRLPPVRLNEFVRLRG
jgi:hypothetical protein